MVGSRTARWPAGHSLTVSQFSAVSKSSSGTGKERRDSSSETPRKGRKFSPRVGVPVPRVRLRRSCSAPSRASWVGNQAPDTRGDASWTRGAGRTKRAGQTRTVHATEGHVRRDLVTGGTIVRGIQQRPTTRTCRSGWMLAAAGLLSLRLHHLSTNQVESGGIQGTGGNTGLGLVSAISLDSITKVVHRRGFSRWA